MALAQISIQLGRAQELLQQRLFLEQSKPNILKPSQIGIIVKGGAVRPVGVVFILSVLEEV